ncbi:MAG: transcription termination/antitermination factor NusG [Planctomycetes bacterium]|nr:transcription termination/antitermination factor NusG [Planctomycetota bacterium]
MEWYIVRVQSNMEERVKVRLDQRIKSSPYAMRFGRVVIPTEKVVEVRKGEKKTVEKKIYPGYVVVEMVLDDQTWYLVQETPGVGDFVGSHGKPTAMEVDEVDRILNADQRKEVVETIKLDYSAGDHVKIKEGPFENFEGIVEDVNPLKGKVSVIVMIFGRATKVELESWQVERQSG